MVCAGCSERRSGTTNIAKLRAELSSAETAAINARKDAGIVTATAAAVQAEAERLRIQVVAIRCDVVRVWSGRAELVTPSGGSQGSGEGDRGRA
jgi:hypothetical protein